MLLLNSYLNEVQLVPATLGDAKMRTTAEEAVRKIDGPQAVTLYLLCLLKDRKRIKYFTIAGLHASAGVMVAVYARRNMAEVDILPTIRRMLVNFIHGGFITQKRGTFRLKAGFYQEIFPHLEDVLSDKEFLRMEKLFPAAGAAFTAVCQMCQE